MSIVEQALGVWRAFDDVRFREPHEADATAFTLPRRERVYPRTAPAWSYDEDYRYLAAGSGSAGTA